ncbi:hypothetical protein SUDANB171_01457 [Streptomyces sp. enrichment culture]
MAGASPGGIVVAMPTTDEGRRTDRAPLVLFLLVAFVAAGVLGAVQPATGIPHEVLQLTQFGPALGVALVALVRPRRVRDLLTGTLPGRGGAGRAVLLLGTAPLIVAAAVVTRGVLTGDVGFSLPGHPLALIVCAQFAGAYGEEIGWRGLLQPLLRSRHGVLRASVTVGVVWGVWHVQVFAEHPWYAVGFLLSAVSMSVVLGVALDGVPGRVPLAAGFHALINVGMLLFMDEEPGVVLPMVVFGVACLGAALLWARAGIRRSGPPRRIPSVPPMSPIPRPRHDVR